MSTRVARLPLGRKDWIAAGQEALIEDGISGVKLSRLTRRLGVTSGSFYHHFTDWQDFLNALADFYGNENVDRIMLEIKLVDDPAERVRLLHTLAEEWDIARLDSAMRVWGTSNLRARAAVIKLDDFLIETIRGAFVELGFSHREARMRAVLGFAAGVGQPFLFGHPTRSQDAADALSVLLDRSSARPD
jgi:AcrR family transcriptional regulator